MRILKSILYVILALYVLFCVGLYVSQDYIIFRPDKLSEDHRFRAGEEVEIEVEKGISLNCLLFRTPQPEGVILYLHGNKGSNRRCIRQASMMIGLDYDVFMVDYRGFGKSDGEIKSEKQLLSDAQKVYDYLKEEYGESRIVLVGYSLGTGMASYLAANNEPRQLFLNSPYRSFCDLKDRMLPFVPDFLVKYPLANEKYLPQVDCPVTIFHGTEDEVIPYDSSLFLKKLKKEQVKLVTLERTGHRRAIFHDGFRKTIREMTERD